MFCVHVRMRCFVRMGLFQEDLCFVCVFVRCLERLRSFGSLAERCSL